jgi:translocation and assembly module TamA
MLRARAREDESLAVRLMKAKGYYDGSAISTIDQIPNSPGRVRATVSATPGNLYTLGSIKIDAQPTVPPGLIDKALPLKVGDPIDAGNIEGAEANVALKLPQQGYPFVKVGQRDVLLDDMTHKGDYTLPVDTGPRASFGGFRSTTALAAADTVADNAKTGADKNSKKRRKLRERNRKPVFTEDHIKLLARFKPGQLYDNRKVDDLRQALVATGLFSTVSVEPVEPVDTSQAGPDGTQQVDLLVRQRAGPWRSIAATGGYSTGEGIKLEGSYTDRNLFPPEGALILNATAGTQEQGAGATFRRSNAGLRDRTFSAGVTGDHSNYDAFDAVTGTLFAKWSYDSTPIWQKKFTYSYGVELTGTNESVYDFTALDRERQTYFIAALPLQAEWDTSDNLLNPTRGYRLKLNVSPETSVRGAVRPYVRTMIEATAYYPVSDSLVIAGRARAGSIFGIARDDLAPSRRYYGGGGGSVRGYGYQRLGPFDPNGDPVGGRSLNEFALEARYRFGDYGIVPFVDGGNSYESTFPSGKDLRFGAGIGGRIYTNFGPLRIDVATPLNPRKGDGKIALYISIGQAF